LKWCVETKDVVVEVEGICGMSDEGLQEIRTPTDVLGFGVVEGENSECHCQVIAIWI